MSSKKLLSDLYHKHFGMADRDDGVHLLSMYKGPISIFFISILNYVAL